MLIHASHATLQHTRQLKVEHSLYNFQFSFQEINKKMNASHLFVHRLHDSVCIIALDYFESKQLKHTLD
jgi:hypothetical protein